MSIQQNTISTVEELEENLSEPTPETIEAMAALRGDIVILGVGGKMGPTLARMAKRASVLAGSNRRIIGVSRFGSGDLEKKLHSWGIETQTCDLLDHEAYAALPDAPNVVFMAGMKFGSTGNESTTWAMNSFVPGLVAERYRGSHIIAFSTGNIYGLTQVNRGGSRETDTPNPAGEYAMSCLGRERIFEYFSRRDSTPLSFIRLYYATELRYGVLVDVANMVRNREPVSVAMGHFNAIWQADASAISLQTFAEANVPPFVLNLAGPETLSVRRIAEEFGDYWNEPVQFTGEESADALLSNSQKCFRLFGYPQTTSAQMTRRIAKWVEEGGESLSKPTHFESRSGKF